MKKISTQKIALINAFFFTAIANAQNLNLQTPAQNILDQFKAIFPIVAGIIFIIVVFINLGHFTKEGGDWKKGLMNIVIFCVVVGVIAGLFTMITSVTL